MTKPEDEKAASAARIRTMEKQLAHARLDALEAQAKHATYSELLLIYDTVAFEHLDADDERLLDLDFMRGYTISMIRGERIDLDSERRAHVDSALAAIRGQLHANRTAGLPPTFRRDAGEAEAYRSLVERMAEMKERK